MLHGGGYRRPFLFVIYWRIQMVKFPHIGLLIKLLADAFLVMQLADKNAENRQNGSKFRDEIKELAAGNSLENFKNCINYLLTQLNELDCTGFLANLAERLISSYQQLLKENHGRQATTQDIYDWLLNDACRIVAVSINLDWHSAYAPSNSLAKNIHAVWFLPDVKQHKSALGVFFDWLETQGLTRYSIAENYTPTYYEKKYQGRNNITIGESDLGSSLRSDWAKRSKLGEFAKTDLQTFENLEEAIWLSIQDRNLMDQQRLRLNLLLARGFDYLFLQLKTQFNEQRLQCAVDQIKKDVAANHKDIPFWWNERGIYVLPEEIDDVLTTLDELTKVKTPKQQDDEQKILPSLRFLKQQQPFAKIYEAVLLWYEGRYFVLSAMPEKGLDYYKKAFNKMKFVWGRDIIEKFTEEALALTAFLGKDRLFFNNVYQYAVAIGLFEPLETREIDHHYHEWSLSFNTTFYPEAYYHSVSANKKQKLTEKGNWVKAVTFNELNKAADKPSKTNVADTRPRSQLQLSINAPDKSAEDVIKLIDSGADVNFTNNSDGTILIEALQKYYGQFGTAHDEKALKIISRLLQEDLSGNINSVTKGKGISALSLAIDCFDITMIKKLLDVKGIDVNVYCYKPEMSYIYYTLSRYVWNNQTRQPVTENQVLEVIELFLNKKASPNGHFINELTPLMLATELGLTKVVKLLLAHGADKNAVNNCGKKAIDYALAYQRADIQALLKA